MATNKRKDAAALFELIDKSTLKVPKNAGALKIPHWWSSNSADSPPADKDSPSAPRPPAKKPPTPRPIAKTPPTDAPADPPAPPTAPAPAEKPEAPIQHRLFDPPPANVAPATTPSIRPPAVGVPAVTPSIKAPLPDAAPAEPAKPAPAPTPAAADTAAAPPPPLPAPPAARAAPKAAVPPAARVFAPQTHAQDRTAWTPRPGAFARLPVWVPATGVAVLVIVVVGVVALARNLGKSPPTATAPAPQTQSTATGVTLQRGGQPRGPQQKMLWLPGEYAHAPELYYIIIYTTPAEVVDGKVRISKVAMDYAKWFGDNGIPVSIENVQPQANGPFMNVIVSAFGFSTATAAGRSRNEIVRIGDLLKKGAFNAAHPQSGLSSPGSAPATPRGR